MLTNYSTAFAPTLVGKDYGRERTDKLPSHTPWSVKTMVANWLTAFAHTLVGIDYGRELFEPNLRTPAWEAAMELIIWNVTIKPLLTLYDIEL